MIYNDLLYINMYIVYISLSLSLSSWANPRFSKWLNSSGPHRPLSSVHSLHALAQSWTPPKTSVARHCCEPQRLAPGIQWSRSNPSRNSGQSSNPWDHGPVGTFPSTDRAFCGSSPEVEAAEPGVGHRSGVHDQRTTWHFRPQEIWAGGFPCQGADLSRWVRLVQNAAAMREAQDLPSPSCRKFNENPSPRNGDLCCSGYTPRNGM